MKFKSIIKMIQNGSKVIMAMAFVFILTVSAVTLSAMASGSGDSDIQAELKALLGEAKGYGVFTENAFIKGDFESNIATNNLTVGDTKDIGNSVGKYTNVAGTIFINNFVSGTLQLRSANNLVLGSEYTDNGNNNITFGGGNILTANYKNVKIGVNADYVNVTDTLSTIAKKLNQFAIDNTNGAVVDFTDKDKGSINILNCKEHICVVNVKMADYNRITKDKLKISKKDDQIIIINIIGNYSEFDLVRYTVNDAVSSADYDKIADTVVFNFADYSGTLHLAEVCAIIIATKANVKIDSTSRGRVIANSFCNPCGEWHFLAKDLEEETEAESTESTKCEPTTIETSKATKPEPTTVETTTKATKPEPTTAETTTKATKPEPTTVETTTKATKPEPTTVETTTKATKPEPTTVEITKATKPEPTTEEITTKATQPEPTTTETTTKATEPEPTTTDTTTKATQTESTSTKTTEAATRVTDPAKTSEVYADEDEVTKPIVTMKKPEVNADQDKVKTGDKNPIIIYFVAIGISAFMILTFVILERKYKDKNKEN